MDEKKDKLKYGDLDYEVIIKKWNEMFYNSSLPTAQDAMTRTYELAKALRNICNNDSELLKKIIPTYDGMTDALKAAQIAKAVNAPALKADFAHNEKVEKTISDIMEDDDRLYYRLLPQKALAMGYRESALKVGEKNLMPMVVCVASVIGGVATNVRLKVDGTFNSATCGSRKCWRKTRRYWKRRRNGESCSRKKETTKTYPLSLSCL